MLFCGLPQFYADRVDDDIEGPFMFLFDMTMDDLDDELNTFRELKKKEAAV